MNLHDSHLEIATLQDIQSLCQNLMKLSLQHRIEKDVLLQIGAQIEIRTLFLLRHYPLAGHLQTDLSTRLLELRRVLSPFQAPPLGQ